MTTETKPLADLLVGEFVPNRFLLDTNRTLQSTVAEPGEPWNLPSRLMRFPLEVQVSSPFVRWAMASTWAERCVARSPARCQ